MGKLVRYSQGVQERYGLLRTNNGEETLQLPVPRLDLSLSIVCEGLYLQMAGEMEWQKGWLGRKAKTNARETSVRNLLLCTYLRELICRAIMLGIDQMVLIVTIRAGILYSIAFDGVFRPWFKIHRPCQAAKPYLA